MNKQIEEMAKAINKSEILCRTCGESTYTYCADAIAELLYNDGYRKSTDEAREIYDIRRYIILNENIAKKCKEENGEQNEEYWKGKISAFRQIRAYIDAELKKKYTEEKHEN